MRTVTDDAGPAPVADPVRPTLEEIADFGVNPGHLRMFAFVPEGFARPMPLVVVMHGCRQTARSYDLAAGWTRLASRHGFIVLYPEQRRANNADNCFQWYAAEHTRRDGGEVASIRQMIATAVARLGADPDRVYVNGLSAGGAMAGAMLAAYPEVFADGAIIAGLPYGTASSLSDARDSMAGRTREAKAWGDLVRSASDHQGPWPSVAIWHGTDDRVVWPINAGELVKQWANVHGVGATIPAEDNVGKAVRRVWRDRQGRACVVDYSLPGLGHGAPVDDSHTPAPFFLPAGLSSTVCIATDWGLTGRKETKASDAAETENLVAMDGTTSRRRLWSIFGR